MDELDMIALKRYSRSPLLAYHTEPFASVVLWELIEYNADKFGHNKLRNDCIYSEKACLKYIEKGEKVVLSLIVANKAWHIKTVPPIPQHIIAKYDIVNNIISENEDMDLVEVAVEFVKDIINL